MFITLTKAHERGLLRTLLAMRASVYSSGKPRGHAIVPHGLSPGLERGAIQPGASLKPFEEGSTRLSGPGLGPSELQPQGSCAVSSRPASHRRLQPGSKIFP